MIEKHRKNLVFVAYRQDELEYILSLITNSDMLSYDITVVICNHNVMADSRIKQVKYINYPSNRKVDLDIVLIQMLKYFNSFMYIKNYVQITDLCNFDISFSKEKSIRNVELSGNKIGVFLDSKFISEFKKDLNHRMKLRNYLKKI